jgi:hypothetical protein
MGGRQWIPEGCGRAAAGCVTKRGDRSSYRLVVRLLLTATSLGVLALTAGCQADGGGQASPGDSGAIESVATTVAAPEEAAAVLVKSKKRWQRTLASNAADDPNARFDNLSEDEFLGRLQSAADEYHFRVVETQWLEPVQAAPLVVVQTDDPSSLAHDAPAILRLLDPSSSDRSGLGWMGVRGLLPRGP